MALFPLKLPTGMARPGTKYDAKGRWYDGTLVRWYEGVMQPIGGWQILNRTAAVDVNAAISDDGGVFTDETTDANDAGVDDVVLIPASPAANDAFYVGYDLRFTELDFVIGTVATDGAVTWEYWDGSAWTALSGVVDDTVGFTVSPGTAAWDLPSDWAQTTVNSQGPFYYVRARVTTVGTSTATGDTVDIGSGPVDVDEAPRGAITWRTNSAVGKLAFGTATKLYAFGSGALHDITPAGFTTGGADATVSSGNYGQGAYGVGPYGVGDEAQVTVVEANTWQLDNYGEDLVACAFSDGGIYLHDTTTSSGLAAAVSGAPTDCKGVVVTPERFLVALAASGDRRQIMWADVDTHTDWTATPSNQAGDHILPGKGEIMAGRRGRDETLIWTDVDLFAMRYIGGEFIYTFPQVGSNCGVISRLAMQVVDGQAIWMGKRGFFQYNGFVSPVDSTVGDYVFNDINRVQASKIWCDARTAYGEVTWYYPSAASNECDKYVTFNYRENIWYFGELERTAGADQGAFATPMACDAGGVFYQHDTGTDYDDPSGTALVPFAESGPIEIGVGDNVVIVNRIIPDENTLGDLDLSIFTALYPTATETESGPFTAAEPTDVRVMGRQIRLKAVQNQAGWRFGTPRLEVTPGGKR
jgi:hypothetical protein